MTAKSQNPHKPHSTLFPSESWSWSSTPGKELFPNVQLEFLCLNLWQQLLVLSLGTAGKSLGPSPDTPWKYLYGLPGSPLNLLTSGINRPSSHSPSSQKGNNSTQIIPQIQERSSISPRQELLPLVPLPRTQSALPKVRGGAAGAQK